MPHLNTDDSGAMTLSPTDRMLRRITALDIIWSLAFLIPYGVIVGRNVAPPLLLIPMGFSSIFALYTLSGKARQRWLNASIDTFIATYLLAMVIAANVTITQRYHYRGNVAVLGIHGTTPGMINCAIHIYFAWREMDAPNLFRLLFGSVFISPTCPHCRREVLYHWGMPGSSTPSTSPSKERCPSFREVDNEIEGRPSASTEPIGEAYRDPRPSTDDESARLV